MLVAMNANAEAGNAARQETAATHRVGGSPAAPRRYGMRERSIPGSPRKAAQVATADAPVRGRRKRRRRTARCRERRIHESAEEVPDNGTAPRRHARYKERCMGFLSKFEGKDGRHARGSSRSHGHSRPSRRFRSPKRPRRRCGAKRWWEQASSTRPRLYTVLVNADDDERLFGYYPTLAGETETYLAAKAAEEGLVMDGQPLVRFIVDDGPAPRQVRRDRRGGGGAPDRPAAPRGDGALRHRPGLPLRPRAAAAPYGAPAGYGAPDRCRIRRLPTTAAGSYDASRPLRRGCRPLRQAAPRLTTPYAPASGPRCRERPVRPLCALPQRLVLAYGSHNGRGDPYGADA